MTQVHRLYKMFYVNNQIFPLSYRCYNEAESLPELTAWIDKVLQENRLSYEIIMVDDGSSDGSWDVIENLVKSNPSVRGIKFRRNYGKSAALHCGFQAAAGEVVITMDADLQDSPDEIPGLYKMITGRKIRPGFGMEEKTVR